MKTKAYKLAAELGLQEQSVLDWLRANGYPNARRADTIRSDVAQAARKALGRGGASYGPRSGASRTPPQSRKSRQPREVRDLRNSGPRDVRDLRNSGPRDVRDLRSGGSGRATTNRSAGPARGGNVGRGGAQRSGDGFKVSFADLLEAHLPSDVGAGRQAVPDTRPARGHTAPKSAPPAESKNKNELLVRIARTEQERDRARQQSEVERARADGLERELQRLQGELDAAKRNLGAIDALRADNERLSLERATLRKQLVEAADERATLEQTCAELQEEVGDLGGSLDETRKALDEVQLNLEEANQESIDQTSVLGDLETARKREVAWRTRALELERAVNQGGDIIRQLRGHGLETYREQARVLRALLGDERSATTLLKSVRQIDAGALEKLVANRVLRTCAHPLCERVCRGRNQVPLRVEDDTDCAVCGGDAEQRWFTHMVGECALAGVRRLLVVGGNDGTRERLRALSQGQPVDLRLVSSEEEATPARAIGRVEGCDALVRWSPWVVPEDISAPYVNAALSAERPIVTVLGRRCGVVPMARATINRLARNHVLRAV